MSRQINSLIIHCSATLASEDIGVREIRKAHIARGFKDTGYHYVIRRNGWIETGRPESQVGAHAHGANTDSIGVCLVGGANARGEGQANFTQAQYIALRAFITVQRARRPGIRVLGHRDTGANKDCPSFDVQHWLMHDEIIEPKNTRGA